MGARLFLVEFIAVDRFHRAIAFPFIKGWARERGIAAAWVRFGLRASDQFELGQAGIDLSGRDRAALAKSLALAAPTHILFSRSPAPGLLALARGQAPGARAAFLDDDALRPVPAGRSLGRGLREALGAWLDAAGPRARPGPDLCETVRPDFGWAAGNDLARRAQPMPFVVCGRECGWERSLRESPFYKGVALGPISTGCAFCRRGRGSPAWRTPPLELAKRQLVAMRRTHPPFPTRPMIRLLGEAPLRDIGRFADMLSRLDFPAADFLLDARVHALIRNGGRLSAALKRLKGTGHRLHICLVGIENFSSVELERMNKGTKPEDNLEAISLLLAWEREHPETFRFREHRGLSMIVFSPWTTLKDVLINTATLCELGVSDLFGKFFNARLRLYPELPLARLAERDGLLIRRYSDPLLDTAKRNFYPDELPWRFQHPDVGSLCRIFTRLEKDPALKGDALYRRVQKWVGPADDLARSALAVARAIADGRKPLVRERLVPHGPCFTGNQMIEDAVQHADASGIGIPPQPGAERVSRVEDVDAAHWAMCRAHPELFANASLYGGGDIFFGTSRRAVEEALALTARFESGQEDLKGAARLGSLLGYPSCCSRAFTADLSWTAGSNAWTWVARRVRTPGRIPVKLNPEVLHYVPCSLKCAESLAGLRRLAARDRDRPRGPETSEGPWLMLLDADDALARIRPLTPPAERFRYRTERTDGSDPRLRRVREGDEMVLEPGCITILRKGREHQHFPLNAFLWWNEGVFHLEYWRQCLAVKSSPRAQSEALPVPEQRKESPEALRLEKILGPRLAKLSSESFAGYVLSSWQAAQEPWVEVILQKGPSLIRLLVQAGKVAQRPYARAGAYALLYDQATPLDSPEKRDAVEALARRLSSWRA